MPVAHITRQPERLSPPDEEFGAALILAYTDLGALDLIHKVLAIYTPEEQERILYAVRVRTRERLTLAGYLNPDGSGRGNWLSR